MKTINSSQLLILLAFVIFSGCKKEMKKDLSFNSQNYEIKTFEFEGKEYKVRAFENIVYVKKPIDTVYQCMNIYIPEEYFQDKSIKNYDKESAPIFFPNNVGGYMPAKPISLTQDSQQRGPGDRTKATKMALSKGYVVASPGARGRTNNNSFGVYTGKAPADIVDLKAAVRYLKFNDSIIPGNSRKIISNGTSAGGAMSALLGATGNSPDYEPYLKSLGAAEATDDIYAVSAYCPITNLDHADAAYEWQFNGVNTYMKMGSMGQIDFHQKRTETLDTLTQSQIEVSDQLKMLFPAYVNSLKLRNNQNQLLTLYDNGNGNFKIWVGSYIIASAQDVLNLGEDLSKYEWITLNKGGNIVEKIDFAGYVRYMKRMKTPPAFDALDLSTGENQLFGNDSIDACHFTKYSFEHSTVESFMAPELTIKMMNPIYYIGDPQSTCAKYWRIRHGTLDKDTSLAISVILATKLKNSGINVNLEMPWNVPHSGDYDLRELFEWIESVCKKNGK
ncbi:MAG: subtype B tannase [Bacteroidales bacterium]|nr:subtype B tannase [Bacteroidales bacterium]